RRRRAMTAATDSATRIRTAPTEAPTMIVLGSAGPTGPDTGGTTTSSGGAGRRPGEPGTTGTCQLNRSATAASSASRTIARVADPGRTGSMAGPKLHSPA